MIFRGLCQDFPESERSFHHVPKDVFRYSCAVPVDGSAGQHELSFKDCWIADFALTKDKILEEFTNDCQQPYVSCYHVLLPGN